MTNPRFGRVTPSQMFMLHLVGYRLSRSRAEVTLKIPDAERIEHMRKGREALKKLTGRDFGYDLAAWHKFLVSNDDYGYKHSYAFFNVKIAVWATAMFDRKRKRLVSQLEN